jgi:serine/threonine protein kinase
MENHVEFVNSLVLKYKVNKLSYSNVKLLGEIGEGQEGKVYQGLYNNEKIAIKIISEFDKKCLESEVAILQNISHKCIPKLYGMIVEANIIALVLQLIEGKTLANIPLKLLKQDKKVEIVKQLCNIIDFIHSKNLIHRDIKPENILISFNTNSLELYLIDYGISRVISKGSDYATRTRGTTYYLAPESLEACGFTDSDDIISTINNKVDVWSFGCVVSYLFSGILPWTNICNDEESAIIEQLVFKNDFPIPDNIKDGTVIDIILKATIIDPAERSTMSDLKLLVKTL